MQVFDKNVQNWKLDNKFEIIEPSTDRFKKPHLISSIAKMTENTENMSPLLFQSSEEPDEYFHDGQPENVDINPTIANIVHQTCSMSSRNNLPTSRESSKSDIFIKSSSEVEIISCGQRSPIILSSEPAQIDDNNIQLSPDLFGSQDDDNDIYYCDSSHKYSDSKKFQKIKVSTPLFLVKPKKENVSDDLFVDNIPNTNDTNVFEITTNDEFPNMIRINSDTEMSPIRVTPDSSPERPDNKNLRLISPVEIDKGFSFFFEKNAKKSNVLHDQSAYFDNSIEFVSEYRETPKSSKRATPKSPFTQKTPSTSSRSGNNSATPNSGKWLKKRDCIDDKTAWRESIKRRNLQKTWFADEHLMKSVENSSLEELERLKKNVSVETEKNSLLKQKNVSRRVSRKSRSLWSSDDEI